VTKRPYPQTTPLQVERGWRFSWVDLVVLAAIFSFKQFTIIFLLTGGGPAGATETLVVRIYNTAFRFYDFSYSATLGVAGFLMAMSIVFVFIAAQKQDEAAELGY